VQTFQGVVRVRSTERISVIDLIIFVSVIVFSALDMIIFGRKKISSRQNTINLLPEKMIVMAEPIVSVREKALAGMSGNPAFPDPPQNG